MAPHRTDADRTETASLELNITRIFDAPRDVVFRAWSDPEQAKRWWGPKGFETTILKWDLRPGGEWRSLMRGPDGKEYPQEGVFLEILPPCRTVYTFKWVNESDPESLITVEFADRGGKTEMTFHQREFKSVESRDSHREGWNGSFDRLAEQVKKA